MNIFKKFLSWFFPSPSTPPEPPAIPTEEDMRAAIRAEIQANYADVVNAEDLPPGAKMRRNVFVSPEDLMAYIRNAGVGADYCFVVEFPDFDAEGNTGYALFITGE